MLAPLAMLLVPIGFLCLAEVSKWSKIKILLLLQDCRFYSLLVLFNRHFTMDDEEETYRLWKIRKTITDYNVLYYL